MKYSKGDKFFINGVEAFVAVVNSHGHAYLAVEHDGDEYMGEKLLKGLVFTLIDERGVDRHGNKAHVINNRECGAV